MAKSSGMPLSATELHSQYLAAIIASSDDAIISKDLQGNITSWNPGAQMIFGYTAEEIVGKHISILIPPENLSEEDYILSQIKQGKRVDHYETIRRHKDGHPIPVSLTVSPIRDQDGKIIGASKISRNISDRIDAERAIAESNRKKDDFIANMSHELRTPMNAVIGLTNLLSSMTDLPERAVKYVDTLKLSAENLMDLINDLLDFSKLESGSFEVELITFSLQEQVNKAIKLMSLKAAEKNLNLVLEYDPALQRQFVGDPLRTHQILMNLLSNAIKFTDKGAVRVSVMQLSDKGVTTTIEIKVTDTGIGIAKENLAYIFDKFMQADTSITRRFGGSGLGLAIAKGFTEKLGGSISVESELHRGTTFTVKLPLRNSSEASAASRSSVALAPQGSRGKKSVLLVEDYEPNILVAGALLEDLGYEYDVAQDGAEALQKFIDTDYKVILMDIQMSEIDGFEATRRIRKFEADKHLVSTPIIAMTAHVRAQDRARCFDAGMDDFIPKPFDTSTFAEKIAHFVEVGRAVLR